jgi:phenylalanyl-tRNA synthetase beta chain
MNISLNWLQDFIKQPIALDELSHKLTMAGLEIENTYPYTSVEGGLEGLIIGQIVDCQKHPNADKLSLCKVNIGSEELLSIVCGAPNVAKDQKVIVAPVGSTIYPKKGEPFEIKSAKIRGESSQGMICAEDEIGLGDNHDGIIILDEKAKIGQAVNDYFNVYRDTILEIGLTANRGDAASHLGVARDVSALFKVPLQMPVIPEINESNLPEFQVKVKNSDACPRYSGLLIKNVKVTASPDWLQNRLKAIGLNPVNNIVDISNYVMHELGQPIHCFDAAKINGKEINVRIAEKGEKITTLDKENRTLHEHELLIADKNQALAIAGVMGSLDSGVSESTSEVFVESAYFNPGIIRKTAKSHGINSDASFRFERGTDPEITITALKRVASLILEIAGGMIASGITDSYPNKIKPVQIILSLNELENVSGLKIPENEVESILLHLGFKILSKENNSLTLESPLYKSDVTRSIDVIEEIVRIYGLDNIPIKSHFSIALPSSSAEDKANEIKVKVCEYLRAKGFHEMMANSLSKEKYDHDNPAVKLLNPLSSDLGVMRTNLLNGALESVLYNQNRKAESILLFEFGKTYEMKGEECIETPTLCIIAAGNRLPESWEQTPAKCDYFFIKNVLSGLFDTGGLDLESNASLVTFDEVNSAKLKAFDIRLPVCFAEINWKLWVKKYLKQSFKLEELPKYQAVRRDLSLILKEETTFEQIKQIAFKTERKHLQSVNVFDVFRGENLPQGTKSYAVSFQLSDKEKTMSDKQIDQIMDKLTKTLNQEFGAVLRS